MTDAEAENQVRFLKGIFTRTTPQLLIYWKTVFRTYPNEADVEAGILAAYHRCEDGFIDRPMLIREIEKAAGKNSKEAVQSKLQKLQELRSEYESRLRREQEEIDRQRAEHDAFFDALSDQQLSQLRDRVIEAYSVLYPRMVPRMLHIDPRKQTRSTLAMAIKELAESEPDFM